MERSDIKCTCKDCGLTWRKGEMGDNEELCFKCERLDHDHVDGDCMCYASPASDDFWDESY